jgi:ABC-2 type transport system permease protein
VVPTFLTLTIINIFFKVNIGFSLTQYLGILMILGALGTSFSLFINAFIKGADNANMIGSASVLLTTILSGSFYSFENGNKVLQKILLIFPQKEFLNFVKALEEGKDILNSLPQILYVITISLAFFFISIIKMKKDYVLRSE